MRRITFAAVGAIFALSLAACSGSGAGSTDDESTGAPAEAGDLTIGGLRVRIEDLPIESAQSEEVRQFGQTRWSCIDRRRRVWLRLALTGSAPSLNGTEVSGS